MLIKRELNQAHLAILMEDSFCHCSDSAKTLKTASLPQEPFSVSHYEQLSEV